MIAFCIDASSNSGFGHFKRCLSIANLYLKNNYKCLFIILEKKEALLLPKIKNCQFYHVKSEIYKNKIYEIKDLLKKKKISQLVFDTYNLKKKTISEFKAFFTIHINDFFNKNFDADVNINPGLISDQNYKIKNSQKNIYIGPQFSCIHDDYLKFRNLTINKFISKKKTPLGEKKILVYFGTFFEAQDIYYRLFLKIVDKKFDRCKFIFIFGSNNLKKKFLEKIKFYKKKNIKFIGYVKNLSKILYQSNFAITGSGLINHEKLSIGIPSIAVILAPNQFQSIKYFKEKKFLKIFSLKKFSTIKKEKLFEIINLEDSKFDEKMDVNDALGSRRVFRLINQKNDLKLFFRKPSGKDLLLYYKWVNNSLVRKNSLQNKLISFNNHKIWFKKKLLMKKNILLICSDENNLPLGQIRYDYSKIDDRYYVDISVDEFFRSQGLGDKILKKTLKLIQNKKYIINNLYSKVLKKNLSSIKIFVKNNFKIVKKESTLILLKYEYR